MNSYKGADPESQSTGLPGLKSWRTVYLIVTAIFVLWVVLLAALSRAFQ